MYINQELIEWIHYRAFHRGVWSDKLELQDILRTLFHIYPIGIKVWISTTQGKCSTQLTGALYSAKASFAFSGTYRAFT